MAMTEPRPTDTLVAPIPDPETLPLDAGAAPQTPTYLRPRRAARRDWFRVGFFFALGAVVLALLALTVRRLSEALLDIITPFALGAVLALLLDPLVRKLERRRLSRGAASGVVFVAFLLLFAGLLALAVPRLIDQATQLAQNGPQYVQTLSGHVQGYLDKHRTLAGIPLPRSVDALKDQLSDRASTLVRGSAGRLTGFLVGSASMLLEGVVTLIVAFYFLVDLGRLRGRLFYLLPEKARGPAGQFSGDIGEVFSDYLSGLLRVCALYGLATILLLYGFSLFPQGHGIARYALLVGVAAGFLYAVPYVGALSTALVTFLVAFAAGGPALGGWAVGATLLLNQVFDNVVTPKVVGGGVGLHPAAAIFALVLGANLFGIWGMLLSVPVAASIQAILFRLYPKLTTPTPPAFLRAQGVPPEKKEAAKILEGDASVTAENQRREQA